MIIVMQEDLQKAMDFYTKLGLKVVFYIPGKWAELQIGDVKIGLCPTATPLAKNHHTGVVFQVDDVMETYKSLKEDGFEFANEPVVATHGIMVSCVDPSGNLFDLYQPTHDKVKQVLEKAGKLCGDSCGKSNEGTCCRVPQKTNGCC